jgi:hypothetical protein
MARPLKGELRRDSRHKVLKDGKIILPGDSTAIDVVVRDLTAAGARLAIPGAMILPDQFDLAMPAAGYRHTAQLRWRQGEEAGVQFIGPPRVIEKGRGRHGAAAHREPAETEAVQSFRAMVASVNKVAQNASQSFHAEYKFSHEPDPLYTDRGRILVDVCLRNASSVPAHQPFVCLPRLGLNFDAAPGWRQQDVVAVRKMARFSPNVPFVLEPLEFVHCATVVLQLYSGNGGGLEYEEGHVHRLAELPDFRLTCIAGAGNFPTASVPLVVRAAEIRDFIARLEAAGHVPAMSEPEAPEASQEPEAPEAAAS